MPERIAWIAIVVLITGCIREGRVMIQEVIVPTGFHGWVEIVQDDPGCATTEVHHDRIVLHGDDRGVICMAEELPALRWFKRDYRFADGSPVPRGDIHEESATGTTTHRQWVKHSAWFCIGTQQECAVRGRPVRLPPGPGWQEIGRDRRVPLVTTYQ